MEHSSGSGRDPHGELLYQGRGAESYDTAAQMAVDGKSSYHGEAIGTDMEGFAQWGLYTQMIWPTTEKLGLGRATTADGKTCIVLWYHPIGNLGMLDPSRCC